jgi:hypothetical protein
MRATPFYTDATRVVHSVITMRPATPVVRGIDRKKPFKIVGIPCQEVLIYLNRTVQFVIAVMILGWQFETPARAADFDPPINLFLDHSYVAWSPNPIKINGDPRSPVRLIFEAQIAPIFFFPQKHIRFNGDSPDELVLSAAVTPLIRLRMLQEDSSPVIPPSFMPKLTLQSLYLKHWEGQTARIRYSAIGLNIILGHYSNGQSGCFFANQTGTDPNCAPSQGQLPLNEVSGSFSTNYYRGELHGQLAFNIGQDKTSTWLVGGGGLFEVNSAFGPGGISDDQRRVYGNGHYGFEIDMERYWPGNRGRGSFAWSIPSGERPHQTPTSIAEAAYLPDALGGFGLFVRYVNGQDYFNILFLERVTLWEIGLSFELSPGIPEPSFKL